MYMQKLTEEEQKEKARVQKTGTSTVNADMQMRTISNYDGQSHGNGMHLMSIQENHKHSVNSVLESIELSSPNMATRQNVAGTSIMSP